MARDSEFIFELLSDVWDDYQDRDRIASLWEGYLQIASDLLLQMLQAHASKSIIDIPVFRRYRWLHFDLVKTVTPSVFTGPFKFAHFAGNSDILNVPTLRTLVRAVQEDEYTQVTNSASGVLQNDSDLIDTGTPFPGGTRVGDVVRFVSGTGLAEGDIGVRFNIVSVNSATSVTLAANDLPDAAGVKYYIERSPLLELTESEHYVVQAGKLNFLSTAVPTADGSETAFRVVEHTAWTGDFVRDDPRLIAAGGNAVVNGTGGVLALGGSLLTDATATFIADGVVPGDYLVVRPSGTLPTQVLTVQIVGKIAQVISETQLEFQGTAPSSSSSLKYDVLRPSGETFDLVSSEDGTDAFPMAYAFKTASATSPSGTTGELLDLGDLLGDEFTDTARDFTGLVGKELRVLSGAGLDPDELSTFIIKEVRPSPDTVLLDRKLVANSTAADAIYIVGDVLTADAVFPTAAASEIALSSDLEVSGESSNTVDVTDGTIAFAAGSARGATPYILDLRNRVDELQTSEVITDRLWAEETIVDQDQLYKNFGFPIQVHQDNSVEYKSVLQGLWYAYWNGPSLDNVERGLNLVFNLPSASGDGVVTSASLFDPAMLTGTVESATNAPPFTFDTSSVNPGGDSRFFALRVNGLPPVLITFPNGAATPSATVISLINAAVGSALATLDVDGRVVLTATTSVAIDAVVGNPGLGFAPNLSDFGNYSLSILLDTGETQLLEFGSEFALSVAVGERVEQFQPLTKAVQIFDYLNLPGWWKVLNIPKINPTIETFSAEDIDIVNDILKDFTFAVRIVAGAFTRMGPVDRSIVRYFLEQIKPTITDYLFAIAHEFFDIISLSDDRDVLGLPPTSQEYKDQHGGENPAIELGIRLNNRRNIEWNSANFWFTDPGDRAAFELNYNLPEFDDYHLETEDVTLVVGGVAYLIDGDGAGVSPLQAEIVGSVDSQTFDTVAAPGLSLLVNGVAVVIAFTPLVAMPMVQVLDEINSVSDSTPGVLLEIARKAPGVSSVRLFARAVPGTPTIQVTAGNASLGLVAAGAVSGTLSLGLLSETIF